MRSGLCSIQHGLTAEAISMVKQAVSFAKRRGHAQVTPLHVASAMLASSGGLLRRACLQSHSHPLQCKALELCFNVALNRLPASTPSPLLSPQYYLNPALSNALVAAFKRAQAHQRRGSIENQQQPILALKIELEQLIISILDDPSVSRVMREAGFSSTQVKNRVEQAVSLEICSQKQSPSMSTSQSKEISTMPLVNLGTNVNVSPHFSQFKVPVGKSFDQVRSEEVMSVLNELSNKRKRNTVIVGECLATAEGVFREVMDKCERGNVPGELSFTKFISLDPLFSLRNSSKEDVEQKLAELGCLVQTYINRGVVLYMGDLKCIAEFWSTSGEERRNYYCPLEHIIMGLKGLVCGIGETAGRLRLFGIATFQTYMRCKTGYPSLETIWELHPLTIDPVGSLSLTLSLQSNLEVDQFRSKVSNNPPGLQLPETGFDKRLSCCTDCVDNFKREAQSIASDFCNTKTATTISTRSSLPSWLQQEKEDRRSTKDHTLNHDQECVTVRDLCKKWNQFCSSGHKNPSFPDKTFTLTSSPPSSTSVSSYERNPDLYQTHLSWPITFEPTQSPKEQQFWISETSDGDDESSLRVFMPERNDPKPELLSNPNSSPNSASSSEVMEDMVGLHMFRELNAENLKILCDALEKKVRWQKDIIPEIATTILQCRSGMRMRKDNLQYRSKSKEETWLFFSGVDYDGKEKVARELAKLVFGSQSNFVSICFSSFSSTRADSTEESKRKRMRDDLMSSSYLEKFGEAVNENPHRVFFMEDIEQIDYCSQKGIKQAIESGRITLPSGDTVPLMDAIIIFSCESFSSESKGCSPHRRQKHADNNEKNNDDDMQEKSQCLPLDLNIAITEEDMNGDHDGYSVCGIGILESVDRHVTFRIQQS
ncbi:protein SMAX1-LIKE 3-like [Juglans microcarpa x Juglans regia]|uniref:protein SMAX1-LIKE 3-like n=1 Tax=Juglans microcarpa x Juglans regia TaxID=2249226 RepID=UPI001B7F25A4|nr:protein SMAX1-LIKE 3-like [Juglans microcarpa x Juglans regia]